MSHERLIDEMAVALCGLCSLDDDTACILALMQHGFRGADVAAHFDEARLPPDCIRTRTEPDKVRIKEHLARGERVDGAELSNSEPVISVRIK